ncbi:two-component sensor histidine kinase [Dulcicalothrix desertica PCC 7102]|uniref:histidine kinase n=1 Tax=Dulcicalothrix desertica PCC 7102 TaxID=232991 RepID=A0A433UUU8_9CYAN|nr:sensor histidine kinase [Dulcicalothrix desertica]RUS97634.1 two-component sensor histidine kinase [Dulcicalothrix desertica PCC 7102]TWH54843.1 signal transduction histidine kinase [Dulcicalothrix desertica PCC 7102]
MLLSRRFIWIFRGAEWLVLLSWILSANVYKQFKTTPELLLPFVIFGIGFFGLSFIFPINRLLWQRRLYLYVQMGLLVAAQVIFVGFSTLFLVFIVKACFLLRFKELILFTCISGLAFVLGQTWGVSTSTFAQDMLTKLKQCELVSADFGSFSDLAPGLADFIAFNALIVLLNYILRAERKSRLKAEALTQEVEALATKLERTRIAREIHDSLGHTLTTLGVKAELAQTIRDSNPEKALQTLDTIKQLVDICLQDVRRAVKTMREEDFDLNVALPTLFNEFQVSTRALQVRYSVELPSLSLHISHQLYCIVQEGLTNIRKHAGAKNINLRGYATTEYIMIDLEDDGKGFNDNEEHSNGFGLCGMRERVKLLNGEIQIHSILNQGTSIHVRIPR